MEAVSSIWNLLAPHAAVTVDSVNVGCYGFDYQITQWFSGVKQNTGSIIAFKIC